MSPQRAGRGESIDQTHWPADGKMRDWLVHCNKIHHVNGQPSLRKLATALQITSRSRISRMLRGLSLPADDAQARNLLTAMGATEAEVERGFRNYQAARAELAALDQAERAARPQATIGTMTPSPLTALWNVPPRNQAFTGREKVLSTLRHRLQGETRTLVHAVHGLGGIGKTQIAIEYAYLFAPDYEIVWWIDAERPGLIGEQLTALGTKAGWVPAGSPAGAAVATVRDRLRTTGRWLLVFDNAQNGSAVRDWLPQGPGHVLITSRSADFVGVAAPVQVDLFDRAESIAFMHIYLPMLADSDIDVLAEELGDLPLALTQAAGMLAETGMTTGEYRQELRAYAQRILDEHRPVDYPASLAAAITISIGRLEEIDRSSAQLARICAWLSPEPIRLSWFSVDPVLSLPKPLSSAAIDRVALRRIVGRLVNFGLVRTSDGTIQFHRLTQAVLRGQQDTNRSSDGRIQAERVIACAEPDNDGSDPRSWPDWAALLPHLLALDPANAVHLHRTALNALWYLLERGEYQIALASAKHWHTVWRDRLRSGNLIVLSAATQLATAYQYVGQYEQARSLNTKTLAQYRRVLGKDHPATLASAHNLAADLEKLGRYAEARSLKRTR